MARPRNPTRDELAAWLAQAAHQPSTMHLLPPRLRRVISNLLEAPWEAHHDKARSILVEVLGPYPRVAETASGRAHMAARLALHHQLVAPYDPATHRKRGRPRAVDVLTQKRLASPPKSLVIRDHVITYQRMPERLLNLFVEDIRAFRVKRAIALRRADEREMKRARRGPRGADERHMDEGQT